LLLFAVACGGADKAAALSRANQGLATALAATNAVRDVLVAWDADAQAKIVAEAVSEESARQALVMHRARRGAVLDAFVLAYGSIAIASSALTLYDAGAVDVSEVVIKLRQAAVSVAAVKTAVDALRGRP
jgi:hypothetical protein